MLPSLTLPAQATAPLNIQQNALIHPVQPAELRLEGPTTCITGNPFIHTVCFYTQHVRHHPRFQASIRKSRRSLKALLVTGGQIIITSLAGPRDKLRKLIDEAKKLLMTSCNNIWRELCS